MTIEELKQLTQHGLEFAKKILTEGREFAPMAILARNDGGLDIVGIDSNFMRTSGTKGELAQILRNKVNDGTVHAIVFLSDMWVASVPANNPVLVSICRQLGTQKASELGFIKREEALIANLDSPIYRQSVAQPYERKGTEIIFGEQRVADDTNGKLRAEGRFFEFFKREQRANA